MSKWDDFKDYLLIFGIGLAGLLGLGYIATYSDRADIKKTELELDFPPEYWEAKKAETEASVRKHEITVASKERLELDARERITNKQIREEEFEKSAPPEYWETKRVEEQERTRREYNKQQAELNRKQLENTKAFINNLS